MLVDKEIPLKLFTYTVLSQPESHFFWTFFPQRGQVPFDVIYETLGRELKIRRAAEYIFNELSVSSGDYQNALCLGFAK